MMQMMLKFVPLFSKIIEVNDMRTTLALDDVLLQQAFLFTGLKEKSALVREALNALIERESAKRLALLGGSEPKLVKIARRQSASQ
jgi:Arc/MetJ family transcription regulator